MSRKLCDMGHVTADPAQQTRHRLPHKPCAGCGEDQDVLHLQFLARHWYCPPCFHEALRSDRQPQNSSRFSTGLSTGLSTGPQPRNSQDLHRSLATIDRAIRYGGMFLRIAGYVAFYVLMQYHPILVHALAGFFIADVAAWTLTSWIDLRFHRMAVLAECAFYTAAAITLQHSGIFHMPEDISDRIMMGLAFTAAFASRLFRYGLKWFHDDG